MSVQQLDIESTPIVAAKQERLRERQIKTPTAAVLALAEMQTLPRPILNIVTAGESVTVIGQITYAEVYDPVGTALRYARAGVDAVTFFTDQQIYVNGLEDLLLVSRGVSRPVICQDFILNEYHVMEARAAGAAGLVLDSRPYCLTSRRFAHTTLAHVHHFTNRRRVTPRTHPFIESACRCHWQTIRWGCRRKF
jgi:hypothetical protein